MQNRTVLIVNGSPRKKPSTSGGLSDRLAENLIRSGVSVRQRRIGAGIATEKRIGALMEDIRRADLIFLISPLYVDALPYNVIEAMEWMKKEMEGDAIIRRKTFMALLQSGMEQTKNRIAMDICRRFALELGFRFGGAFALGFGGVLNGAPLNSLNRLTRHVQKALAIMADSIAEGRPVPDRVQSLLARPLMPGPLFVKRILFNAAMTMCRQKRDFGKGVYRLHAWLKPFYS